MFLSIESFSSCTHSLLCTFAGVTSVYEWQGAIEEDQELLLMIKTTQARLPELTSAVQQLHTYDECEVVAVPVAGGSDTYLRWVEDTVSHRNND